MNNIVLNNSLSISSVSQKAHFNQRNHPAILQTQSNNNFKFYGLRPVNMLTS